MSFAEISTIDEAVEALRNLVEDAKRSGVTFELGRSESVVAIGNEKADLMVIAQALGQNHDTLFDQGPGKLLSDILMAIGLPIQDVYICHITGRLTSKSKAKIVTKVQDKITAVQPSMVLVLGDEITQMLQNTSEPFSALRGQFYEYDGVMTMSTLHPTHLMKNPSDKKIVWEDMKNLHAKLVSITGKDLKLKGSK